jgi:hypothetical protein
VAAIAIVGVVATDPLALEFAWAVNLPAPVMVAVGDGLTAPDAVRFALQEEAVTQ